MTHTVTFPINSILYRMRVKLVVTQRVGRTLYKYNQVFPGERSMRIATRLW